MKRNILTQYHKGNTYELSYNTYSKYDDCFNCLCFTFKINGEAYSCIHTSVRFDGRLEIIFNVDENGIKFYIWETSEGVNSYTLEPDMYLDSLMVIEFDENTHNFIVLSDNNMPLYDFTIKYKREAKYLDVYKITNRYTHKIYYKVTNKFFRKTFTKSDLYYLDMSSDDLMELGANISKRGRDMPKIIGDYNTDCYESLEAFFYPMLRKKTKQVIDEITKDLHYSTNYLTTQHIQMLLLCKFKENKEYMKLLYMPISNTYASTFIDCCCNIISYSPLFDDSDYNYFSIKYNLEWGKVGQFEGEGLPFDIPNYIYNIYGRDIEQLYKGVKILTPKDDEFRRTRRPITIENHLLWNQFGIFYRGEKDNDDGR